MPRRILLVGKGESLPRAWRSRSFGLAGADLETLLHVPGFALDDTYHPVRVAGRLGSPADRPAARGFRYARAEGGPIDTYAVRAIFDDEEAVHRLRRERGMDVVGVCADPAVSVFPSAYCGSGAIGTADDVARRVGVSALRAHGLTGKSVHVAVVDTGIDGSRIPVAGGWAPGSDYVPGSAKPDHGTMVAYDVRIAAPEAKIYDYALLRTQAGTWSAFLSDAIAAFAAVTVTDRRLGYSSQGPGGLHTRKPDLAGFSHFAGSGVQPVDGGTSAASPVAAGVAAALRQRLPASALTPAQLKGALQRSARDLAGRGWDYDLGYGVIDAAAAMRALGLGTKRPAAKRTRRRVGTRR